MSTGASNDFERATKMARAMVTRYGMSEALGTMVYVDDSQDQGFGFNPKSVSEETQQKVDDEIRAILDQQYALARRLLEANRDKVEAMTKALLEWETVDADQINDIMAGVEPRQPKYGDTKTRPVDSGDITPSATAPA
jgi:cell division protease FtsH